VFLESVAAVGYVEGAIRLSGQLDVVRLVIHRAQIGNKLVGRVILRAGLAQVVDLLDVFESRRVADSLQSLRVRDAAYEILTGAQQGDARTESAHLGRGAEDTPHSHMPAAARSMLMP